VQKKQNALKTESIFAFLPFAASTTTPTTNSPTRISTMTTATKKAPAKSKRAKRDYEADLVNGLIELMEAGTNPWQRDWRGRGGSHHRNLVTGHIYTGGNPALLELQMMLRGLDCPLWVGIGTAKKNKWFPKKGTKACCIIRPYSVDREVTDSDGKPVLDEKGNPERVQFTGFSYTGGIFNAMDLQGEGLDEAIKSASNLTEVERPEPERHAAAEAVLGNWQVPVKWLGNRAYYSPTRDEIQLPSREDFNTAAGLYGTWAHEVIHSTGHQDRLKRDGIVNFAGFGSDSYAKEELIAELGAFLLCTRLEISSNADNHASYLQSWIKCLKEQPSFLRTALTAARKAADLLVPQNHDTPD
jgi:antirestriction protein ArdC